MYKNSNMHLKKLIEVKAFTFTLRVAKFSSKKTQKEVEKKSQTEPKSETQPQTT